MSIHATVRALIATAAAAISAHAHAGTFNVPGDFATIDDALANAPSGSTVVVGPGTWSETIDFRGKDITLESADGRATTIIDGGGITTAPVVTIHATSTISPVLRGFTITGGASSGDGAGIRISSDPGAGLFEPLVDDCIIELNSAGGAGGGVYISGASSFATLSGCTLETNSAGTNGGGLALDASTVTLSDCLLIDNDAAMNGGGFHLVNSAFITMTDCIFNINTASEGGAAYISNATANLTRCQALDNIATGDGGGYRFLNSQITLDDSVIKQNEGFNGGGVASTDGTIDANGLSMPANIATNNGGAMFITGSSSSLTDCSFISNQSGFRGAAIFAQNDTTEMLRCRILLNVAQDRGGGIRNESGELIARNVLIAQNTGVDDGGISTAGNTTLTLTNCTIADNLGNDWPGINASASSRATLTNCNIWNNLSTYGGGPSINYCNLPALHPGTGNISADPAFVDPNGASWPDLDYRLKSGSPCIDAGDTGAAAGLQYDLDAIDDILHDRAVNEPGVADTGAPFWGLYVDIGAYEFQSSAPIPQCPGDADGNGVVNVNDISFVVFRLGTTCL